jgi:hypothetical protein
MSIPDGDEGVEAAVGFGPRPLFLAAPWRGVEAKLLKKPVVVREIA